LDPNSHVPIYEQIVEHVRGSVAAGVYRPGETLPSIRALALELVVNPNTVQRAYQELERQGLVYTRKGLGVFVSKNGEASAQGKSEAAIYARFSEGIQLGRSANVQPQRIRATFDKAWQDSQHEARDET
jgi:GntR family transcriptional regulator